MIKIDKPIVAMSVKGPEDQEALTVMNERLKRPEALEGFTYKVKTPDGENAMYVTINDIVLNKGTDNEERRPFEMFINSKNMEHFQWVVALTRVVSAVFRKGGDVEFLVEELGSVFDPNGGYFRDQRYVPSLVAEIGGVLKKHLAQIKSVTEAVKSVDLGDGTSSEISSSHDDSASSEDHIRGNQCPKCFQYAMVISEGCETCKVCGYSKCG